MLRDLIGEVAAGGGAVVFTDHRESVVSARASAVHHLSGGRLTAAGTTALAEISLLLPEELDLPWPRLPGVLSVRHTGRDTISLRVAQDRCDDLLRTALASGCSVRLVRR